ncbi:hypothetical protein [Filomicrobium sp.]|uniref:hypothetical protein n=1 Tax=Filomicrobium sp. TaxID=2024831 RepID=UPI002584C52B|nr:hypothetical protein [Filomicrobium sp.]MCV0371708.1 hypothetical protein [Filomicrobium sp.]
MTYAKDGLAGFDNAKRTPFRSSTSIPESDVQNAVEHVRASLAGTAAAQFIVADADANVPNAREATDTATVAWDFATAGQAKANVPDSAITYAKIQNVSATARVLGRNTAGAGVVEEIDEATFKALFNLEIGTDVQAYAANLDSWSLVVPSDYVTFSTLASTANGEGASLVGIEDAGGLFTATQVEAALAELRTMVNALDAAVVLAGDWDASTGSFPGGGTAQRGYSYIVTTGGTVDGVSFSQDDRIVALVDNASPSTYAANWLKLDYTDQVLSVAGKTGAVTLVQADIGALTTADSPQFAGVNIGHASDTTIGRVSAGVVGVEGQALAFQGISLSASTGLTGGGDLSANRSFAIDKATAANVRAAVADKVLTSDLVESAATPVALSDAATVAIDWDGGINFTLTVTANRVLGNPTNGQPGTWRTVYVQGDDGTARTITFDTQYGGDVPSLTDIDSTKKYLISIYCVTATHFLATAMNGSAP